MDNSSIFLLIFLFISFGETWDKLEQALLINLKKLRIGGRIDN